MEAHRGEIAPTMVERSLAEVRHLARIVRAPLRFTKSEPRFAGGTHRRAPTAPWAVPRAAAAAAA